MIFDTNTKQKAFEYLESLFKKDKKVKIEAVKKLRSLSENAYMHGVVFSVFAIDLGWTLDEAKQYFKGLFLTYKKDGVTFVKETSKLDTAEMEHFLECCRTHALKEHQIIIPLPNEVSDEILAEIYKHDKYLH